MIDLVWTGTGEPPVWPHGVIVAAGGSPGEIGAVVERHAHATRADALLHWDHELVPDRALLDRLLAGPGDVWHGGLRLGMGAQPAVLDYVAPTVMLNRDPAPDIEATSWRLSLRACLVRTEVVRALGHLDGLFETVVGAALELGQRWVRSGALVRHIPALAPVASTAPPPGLADELRFVHRTYGRKWLWYAAWRLVAERHPATEVWRSTRRVQREPVRPAGSYTPQLPTRSGSLSVTVLIPTLERYPWLEVVLGQLRSQTVPAAQVLVIDQTALARRRPDLYAQFDDLPLQVIFKDQRGQATARNAGLDVTTSDAVLFIDDDDEVPPDFIERHLALLRTGVDASCGVVTEHREGRTPPVSSLRTSDVFPTGNALLRVSSLAGSGLFDLAFDHGIRADGDLGMRLYLSGALLVLDTSNEVLHTRAATGGLREYGARTTTYQGSRTSLLEINRLAPTEVYLARRYFTARQVREMLRLRRLGALSRHGSPVQRGLRIAVQLGRLPLTRREMARACREADRLLEKYPVIPELAQRS